MKTNCNKNKRISIENKSEKDYVSETISFVIKGQLTPIHLAKTKMTKKRPVKKMAIKAGETKAKQNVKKTTNMKANNKKTKVISKSGKQLIETAVKKEKISNKTVKKIKNESEIKKSKKDPSTSSSTTTTKRSKSPQKPDCDKTKFDDIKTKQTIEKLLKQANRALKHPTKSTIKRKKSKQPPQDLVKTEKIKTKTKPERILKNKPKTNKKSDSDDDDDGGNDEDEDTEEESKIDIKTEPNSDTEKKSLLNRNKSNKIQTKSSNIVLMKKRLLKKAKDNIKQQPNKDKQRKMKLFNFWNGPKRHRVASLNALAKVHCLYENETRSTLLDTSDNDKKDDKSLDDRQLLNNIDKQTQSCTRTLRSVPGLRAIGKHWDMHDTTSSSDDNSGYESNGGDVKTRTKIKKERKKVSNSNTINNCNDDGCKKTEKRRRNRTELIMDLKDMVVRKRMASLNASAILAASYSVEKRTNPKKDYSETEDSSDYFNTDNEDETNCENFENNIKKEDDNKLIEVRASPNKKVAVILNQDTDVTITGVYVNSTTRSTHHEGYCSIAGMQYRISATSHTQTAATAVATETLLSSNTTQDNNNPETVCKSYTPLDALSNMQPPSGSGTIQHGVPTHHQHMGPTAPPPPPPPPPIPSASAQHVLPLSPNRRHGCTSAFTTPHTGPSYHHPASAPPSATAHHHPLTGESSYVHGYYQPAGPLISVPHGHTQQSPLASKSAPLSDMSPTSASPIQHQTPAAPSSNGGDSSDSEVIITSVTAAKDTLPPTQPQQQQPPNTYRFSQYPGTPPGYSYSYPHYYPTAPPAPSYAHHDLCYPPSPYLHHKYPPPTAYRRYLPNTQYYTAAPNDIYAPPPTGPAQQSQQVVTAPPSISSSGPSYQPSSAPPPPAIMESYAPPPPPPPTLVETYPHPAHYYPGYGPAPPPSCYTHSPTRTIPYINATYQSCPCPMQSCPKNVLTGPLTGDSKRSNITSIAKDSMPLPPVALALPLEPASATGPPSPARGSAGMPPPPSPAGANYQQQQPPPLPPPSTTTTTTTASTTPQQQQQETAAPKQESHSPDIVDIPEKKRKARIGKAMVRNNIAAIQQNTMLLMCNPNQTNYSNGVKREIESPKEKDATEAKKEICSDDEEKIVKIATSSETTIKKLEDTRLPDAQNFKKEANDEKLADEKKKKVENEDKQQSVLPPCINTVAENVKMKNMKRKLSLTTTDKNVVNDEVTSPKKLKTDNKYLSGSYKDLIKKDITSIQINNGRRKLIKRNETTTKTTRHTTRTKKRPVKRKSCNIKTNDETLSTPPQPTKRSKQSIKVNNNRRNCSKTNTKDTVLKQHNKDNTQKRITAKKSTTTNNTKKTAPVLLDHLLLKNSIDRTIDSVISESLIRTNCVSNNNNNNKTDKCTKTSINNEPALITTSTTTTTTTTTTATLTTNRKSTNKTAINSYSNNNNNNSINNNSSKNNNNLKTDSRVVKTRRKSTKLKEIVPQTVSKVPRRSLQLPRWSNGWTWKGDPYDAKVFLNSDETTVVRKCYPAMQHEEGDIIEVRDCVLLKAGPRKNDLPFVAKIAYLWENPDDGEMMMSLLWYYRPEHTEQGRLPADQPDEVFASRHKDSNSVACIDDKCYVLTFHEYCRYRKELKRVEEGIEESLPCIPIPEPYPRHNRQPPSPLSVSADMVFFCRRVYDFRQKRIVKNPS